LDGRKQVIEFNIKSYSEHNFVRVEMYNHQTGSNITFFHNKSEIKGLADFMNNYLEKNNDY
jgi:hypothetical protein